MQQFYSKENKINYEIVEQVNVKFITNCPQECAIITQHTMDGTPEQNGVDER